MKADVSKAADSQMTTDEKTFEVIKEEPESISIVVDLVRQVLPSLSEGEVKAAVWRLHSRGLVDVTPEWKFKRR